MPLMSHNQGLQIQIRPGLCRPDEIPEQALGQLFSTILVNISENSVQAVLRKTIQIFGVPCE